MNALRKLRRDNSGVTAIEYGLIVAIVSIALITALNIFKEDLAKMFELIGDRAEQAGIDAKNIK